jgi:ribonuclease R
LSVISRDNYQTLLLRNYGIKNGFSRYIESEKNLKFPDTRKVADLIDKNVITMDHKFKVAYDDAISVERLRNGNYLLGVYITDVSSFVGMDTVLYEDARQRGESIYGDQKNKFYLPMFPREMTKNFFSLNQGEDKYVIAHFFEFSSSFDFIGY